MFNVGIGVSTITTKTKQEKYSATTDDVTLTLCDGKQVCCSIDIKNWKQTDGKVDMFTDPKILGDCMVKNLGGVHSAQVSKWSSNGWNIEWIQVAVDNGLSYMCKSDSRLYILGYSQQSFTCYQAGMDSKIICGTR